MTTTTTIIEEKRKLWLDALRGVSMILVVYGHCVQGWTEFFVFTNPVKMPLFFVISAYLFNPRSGDSKVFFKNIFLKLVVPWMVLGMFPYTHPKETFINLISGNTAWFMPCLIIAETIWFYINKISKSLIHIVVIGLVVSTIGLVMNHYHLLRVVINTALVVQAFFVLGLLVKTYEQEITAKWKLTIPVLGLIYLVMGGGNFMALARSKY